MNTTNLFVELVVVGTGAALAVVLLFYTLFGDYAGFSQKLLDLLLGNLASIIPVLSFVYVLGIVVDKIAYRIFKPIEDCLREKFNATGEARRVSALVFLRECLSKKKFDTTGYYKARHSLFTTGTAQKAVEAFEFGRSKIRICRGWTINCVLLILTLIGFMVLRHGFDYTVLFAIVALGLLAGGTIWSWKIATDVEHRWLEGFQNMDMYQSVEDELELRKLNRESFRAEDDAKREPLERILADDFRIVRSNYVIEEKPTMLNRVAADTPRRKREVDDENVKMYGDSAVVTSRVTLKEESGEIFGRFWNTKVFVSREEEWKCLAWQVTRIP